MVHWEASYKYGKAKEEIILPLLRAYFGRDIQAYPNQYADFDFYDDLYEYEVKSRTNTYAKYPTTMITQNKTEKVTSKNIILLFNFTDGLYYIHYNQTQFSKYQTRMFSRLGEKWDEKKHIYIPIADLKKIELEETKEDKISVGGIAEIIIPKPIEDKPKPTFNVLYNPKPSPRVPIYKR